MFDRLKKVFQTGAAPDEAEEAGDPRLAVAALLVEAARSDEEYTDAERRLIERALAARFDLDADAAAALRAEADAAQTDARDLHRFTKIVKQTSYDDRVRLIETMWRLVLSDEVRTPHEDALIRRVCGLIYVEDRDSGRARQRVEAERA